MDASTGDRYDALLAITDSIHEHRDLASLLHHLSALLRPLVPFDFLVAGLYDEATGRVTEHTLVATRPLPDHAPRSVDVHASLAGRVIASQQPLLLRDVAAQGNGSEMCLLLQEAGVGSVVILPMTTAVRRIGALAMGAFGTGLYDHLDLEFLRRVANQVAVAIDNALHTDVVEQQRAQLAAERDRWRVALEVNNALVSTLDLQEVLRAVVPSLGAVVPFDAAFIALHDPGADHLRLVAWNIAGRAAHIIDEPSSPESFRLPAGDTALGRAFATGQPLRVDEEELARLGDPSAAEARRRGIRSGCAIPLIGPHRSLGAFIVASSLTRRFTDAELELLVHIGRQMAIAIENALAYQQLSQLSARLADEKRYLEGEVRSDGRFENIIGTSAALRRVMTQVETVAATDSTVLVLGETGTGKELVARAIHDASSRRGRTFVRVNCAAIPSGLLESELFGHEKGAFTGALMRKIGRFELADGGTILLDEIGDIPLELQPKLLRVLQEHEFERLGNARSVKVDVRVIASTNRDLRVMVDERQFRADLFYRLNVFPIEIPPLRERAGDIPLLVQYFVERHARRLKRSITRIPAEAMDALRQWEWPGNVRELENVIERAVILSRGEVLELPLPITARTEPREALPEVRAATAPPPSGALDAVERAHILRVLKETRWVVGGPDGAAARLRMKRTTLASRMRKLGIVRPRPE